MRTFGTDKPEMYLFKIGRKQYGIPAPSSLSVNTAREIARANGDGNATIDVFVKLLDDFAEGATDLLTVGDMNDLIDDWSKFGEVEAGE